MQDRNTDKRPFEGANALLPDHHALLFSALARNILSACGEAAEAILSDAIKSYAIERGGRMRKRAIANGDGTSMASYRAYCEWTAPPGSISSMVAARSPVLVTHTLICPWYEAWKRTGRLHEGAFYCRYVDEYLVRGFDESLVLEVKTMHDPSCSGHCEFRWNGIDLTQEEEARIDAMRARAEQGGVKDWRYHMGHLISSYASSLRRHGIDEGAVLIPARADFASLCGEGAASVFGDYDEVDYEAV
ncbi:MAG: L-2-amino-thiazoline-4-carboxylic acid hydrolase [Clostridia bacterium]|nr:L-2-amino-thiazoline-4-carboxylic acid hydrolase [Clostridia bacterium]